jgi:murein DD-endopeptidase MepM/ murein hydrolase activator NlpD
LVARAGGKPRLYRMKPSTTRFSAVLAASLIASVGFAAWSYVKVSNQRDALQTRAARLEARTTTLETQLAASKTRVTALEADQVQTYGKLAQAKDQIKRFNAQAKAIQGQVVALQAQVSRVNSSADETGVARASSRAAAFTGDPIRSLESLFGQLNSADRRVKGAIESLEKQADQEARIPSGRPVEGSITSTFGFRFGPRTGKLERHTGWDIAAPEGTPAEVTASGTVIEAGGSDVGYGQHVVVDHGNGLKTLYGHLSRIDVAVGDEVVLGGVIGLVGSTGNSTGPHLHYEVRLEDVAVDPGPFLDRQRPPTPLLPTANTVPLGTGLPPSRPLSP